MNQSSPQISVPASVNKHLRCIPYFPELKTVCSGIASTILMQQLEYWFAHHRDGFYKFLAPCRHPKYKQGDSWIEELQFSPSEFRTAFDKIGIRYKTKKQFDAQVIDPFQGYFYLSYIDINSGLTFYRRHHICVDQLLESTVRSIGQHIDYLRDEESPSPEMKKVDTQRLQNVISRDEESLSPYKEQKITAKDDTETTATICSSPLKISDQVSYKNINKKIAAVENKINNTLTKSQELHLQVVAKGLLPSFSNLSFDALMEGLRYCLCDRKSYSKAGMDFFKKLNTIQKAIRQGRWTLPVAVTEKKEMIVTNERMKLQLQWRELKGECDQLQELIATMKVKQKEKIVKQLQQQMDRCCDQLRTVEAALREAATSA